MSWENTKAVLELLGGEAIELFKKKMDNPDPFSSNATFTLYNSANYKIVVDNEALKLLFTAPDQYYDKSTGKLYLEQGRRAGSTPPPIRVIKKWVIDRSIPISPYAIQKSIARKGIKPKPYIAQIRRELLVGQHIAKLEDAIVQDVKNILGL